MSLNRIVLRGAGNVATHLGEALSRAGYSIVQVYSRTEASASELAVKLHCSYTVAMEDVTAEADLYVVSVKDDALPVLAAQLGKVNREALFVHTAGSVPMDVWKGKADRYGVLYPMQTFSKQRPVDFTTVSFFVEALRKEDSEALMELAVGLGGKAYEASSEQRRFLHIAAVFACNFSNHMYAVAKHLLDAHGLPFEAMYPLIDETARKVHEMAPVAGQTGPAQRNDVQVMDGHLNMLADEPELAEIYRLVSRNIYKYSSEKE